MSSVHPKLRRTLPQWLRHQRAVKKLGGIPRCTFFGHDRIPLTFVMDYISVMVGCPAHLYAHTPEILGTITYLASKGKCKVRGRRVRRGYPLMDQGGILFPMEPELWSAYIINVPSLIHARGDNSVVEAYHTADPMAQLFADLHICPDGLDRVQRYIESYLHADRALDREMAEHLFPHYPAAIIDYTPGHSLGETVVIAQPSGRWQVHIAIERRCSTRRFGLPAAARFWEPLSDVTHESLQLALESIQHLPITPSVSA